jgi:hypothetical protein
MLLPMHFLKRIYYWDSSLWTWIGFTILPSLLPFVVTLITSFGITSRATGWGDYIKMTDVIFMGLTIMIGNFNQLNEGVDKKVFSFVLVGSMMCMMFLCMILSLAERDQLKPLPIPLVVFAIFFVSAAAAISYVIMYLKRESIHQN